MTETIKVKNPFTRNRKSLSFSGKTRTKQCFLDECNINNIMKKWEKGMAIEHVNTHGGQYGDFSNLASYQENCEKVIQAENIFMDLPAKIRSRFSNNPANFFEFVSNPSNLDEMISLGLARRTEEDTSSAAAAGDAPQKAGEPAAEASQT